MTTLWKLIAVLAVLVALIVGLKSVAYFGKPIPIVSDITNSINNVSTSSSGTSGPKNNIPVSSAAHINSLSPDSGPTGTQVTIHGSNFAIGPHNSVNFSGVSDYKLNDLSSSDGTSLVFVVPAGDDYACFHSTPKCYIAQRETQQGEHSVTVNNGFAASNSATFNVTFPCAKGADCGAFKGSY